MISAYVIGYDFHIVAIQKVIGDEIGFQTKPACNEILKSIIPDHHTFFRIFSDMFENLLIILDIGFAVVIGFEIADIGEVVPVDAGPFYTLVYG